MIVPIKQKVGEMLTAAHTLYENVQPLKMWKDHGRQKRGHTLE